MVNPFDQTIANFQTEIERLNQVIRSNQDAQVEADQRMYSWYTAYTHWAEHEDAVVGVQYWQSRWLLAEQNIIAARAAIDEQNSQLVTAKKARAEYDANLALAGREGLIGDQAIARANALLQSAVTRRNIATIAAGVLAAIALIWFIRQKQKAKA